MSISNPFARLALFPVLGLGLAAAQTAPPVMPRVSAALDDSRRVTLHGNVHPFANPSLDQGAVEDSLPAGRMLLLLSRSSQQESALQDYIQAAHTPGNPAFHKWLRPEEFGHLYGPADSDLAAITAWLQAHGLTVNKVHAGRGAIEFSGTASQIQETFQTEIHRYATNGEAHLAAATEPSVPAALAPVIAGLASLGSFHPRSQMKVMGTAAFNPKTHAVAPQWTYPAAGGVSYALAPGDLAVQYDIQPVYASGVTGAGQSIAIVSASNVDLSLVQAYQSLFGLAANLPAVIVDGTDPGQTSDATEAYLDIELAGSVAPGAKVLLYTSGGTALTDGLPLAAVRAVEDDQAGIISVSYGVCEAELGQSGNAFWSALWEQAAAQGQTVFVSAGDGGSAGCDDFDAQEEAYAGLQVNGIASTPYNVAVGGTDFYYSQYAGGSSAIAAQLNTYWSASTVTPAVSLKHSIPEQAWNDFFGFNLVDGGKPDNLGSETIVAGGGGGSNAALYPAAGAAGYPKPTWQQATGVPTDHVRDLPDLSLFAANGYNSSFYPICANPGDCTNSTSGSAVVITAIGGTSAAAVAMAAIQALVNQSTGSWSGQANYLYYPLAAKQPGVFRDVQTGGNQVLCYSGSANCVNGVTGTTSSGFTVESGYSAGAGYDLATGLGSVDVANLIKYWKSVTFKPSTTTFSVSPATLVHGKKATIIATIAPASGSGTPTGSIALIGADALPASTGIDNLQLTAGAVYASIDNLPGGAYLLTASYSGDATYAPSKSAPVTLTVTPESDTLSATGWAWNPYDLYLYPLSSGITLPYGAQLFLDAQPLSANATLPNQPTPATGTVTFTDKLGSVSTTSVQPLNAAGMAEWSSGVFAPGTHTLSAAYSGDPSYSASTLPTAATFTIIPGSTSLSVVPLVKTISGGGSVAVDVQLGTGYLPLYGKPPTGSVTVTLGGKSTTTALQAFGTTGNASLEAVVTFSNVAAGILPVTASYPGDTNWQASTANGGTVIALSGKLTPTVTLTATPSAPTPAQTVTLTAAVSGPAGKPSPTGTVIFLGDDQTLNYAACLAAGKASVSVPASSVANGVNIFSAVYQGDANYNPGSSNPLNITVTRSDFSLATLAPQVAILPGNSATATLVLTSVNGFTGTVALTESAPSGITATFSSASPSVSAATTGTVTLTAAASVAPGTYPVIITATAGGHVHTAQVLIVIQAAAAPVFSPAAGAYKAIQQVTLSDPAPGAVIYYTTNGTTPTAASTQYTGAISISAAATLKAIAVVNKGLPSAIASATYTVTLPAAVPSISPAAGTYTSTQSVTITDTTAGATIYYTTNGSAPTTASTKYTGAISVASTETIQAVATATGYSLSPVASAAYTIQKVAASPKLSPAAGTYTSTQSVTITDATAGATIYYTTNGSAPTASSTKYTGAISVTATETIQAVATATGYSLSPVASAAYTIQKVAASPKLSPAAGTYTSTQSVTITDATAGATIYYTTNGSAPTTASTKYTGAISVTATETIQAVATATGYSLSPVASAAYTIQKAAASPQLSPAAGTFTVAQSVTITDTTPGATIYYTTNGSTPTTSSTKYTAAIKVSATQTISAIAVAAGYASSPVVSATYTLASNQAKTVASPRRSPAGMQ
jgi:hypothetical protein